MNIIVSQAIAQANFHPHDNFLIAITWQFFPQAHVHLPPPHVDFSIFVVISCSIYSLVVPTVWGACTLWMSSQPLWMSSKSSHSNRWKAVLDCLLFKLTTTFSLSASLLLHLLESGPFQTLFSRLISFYITHDFFDLPVSLVSQTISICLWQHQSHLE